MGSSFMRSEGRAQSCLLAFWPLSRNREGHLSWYPQRSFSYHCVLFVLVIFLPCLHRQDQLLLHKFWEAKSSNVLGPLVASLGPYSLEANIGRGNFSTWSSQKWLNARSPSLKTFLLAVSRSKGINWSQENWPEEAQMGSSLELDS